MFDWLKSKVHEKGVADRIQKHMATAVGSPLERSAIALAMTMTEDELVQEARSGLAAPDQEVFMIVFECMVIWALTRGFDSAGMRHDAEIQAQRRGLQTKGIGEPWDADNWDPLDIVKKLKKKNCGLVEVAQVYFQDVLNWSLADKDTWTALSEVAAVRNCMVHDAGVTRDSNSKRRDLIEKLESRKWRGRSVGIEVERFQGKDDGKPIIIHRRFLEYVIDLLERYFKTLSKESDAKVWKKKGS